jgi:hypothetical protein
MSAGDIKGHGPAADPACATCGLAATAWCGQCVGALACAGAARPAPARVCGPAVGGTCRSQPGFAARIGEQQRGGMVHESPDTEGGDI